MSISKVWIEDGCTGCGLCADICPEVFVVEGTSMVYEDVVYSDYEAQIKDAADGCPVEVIKYSE